MRKGDVLLWLVSHPGLLYHIERGRLANRLLSQFFRGYPVERLSVLLKSGNDRVVNTGVWLAWELQEDAEPVLDELVVLLSHPLPDVRGRTAQCVLSCAGSDRGDAIGRAVSLIDDPAHAVRRSVKIALMFPNRELLLAGAHHLDDTALIQLFRDLPARGWTSTMVTMEAAALALDDGDSSSLRRMAEEGSLEEKGFAEWYLRLLELRPPGVA